MIHNRSSRTRARRAKGRVRYAVVGAGWIAQKAVLPAFANAPNSELAALVTSDQSKAEELGRRYNIQHTARYEDYETLLSRNHIDAVYIALPNTQHREYTVRAARAGVHVLCEKPMAETELECMEMNEVIQRSHVKLMVAYRLHLEEGNLRVINQVKSGAIGQPRFFSSVFSQNVEEGNIRLKRQLGGGPLMDMGIYCINAARHVFQDEPVEATAFRAASGDPRFTEVPEMVSAILRFPQDRLAQFTCSFGAAESDMYQVVGTKGDIQLQPAYDFSKPYRLRVTVESKTEEHEIPLHDQFGAELVYFSQCILEDRDPQPSGQEGLADVRVVEAIMTSLESSQPVEVRPSRPPQQPGIEQEIKLPPVKAPEAVGAASPSGES